MGVTTTTTTNDANNSVNLKSEGGQLRLHRRQHWRKQLLDPWRHQLYEPFFSFHSGSWSPEPYVFRGNPRDQWTLWHGLDVPGLLAEPHVLRGNPRDQRTLRHGLDVPGLPANLKQQVPQKAITAKLLL